MQFIILSNKLKQEFELKTAFSATFDATIVFFDKLIIQKSCWLFIRQMADFSIFTANLNLL